MEIDELIFVMPNQKSIERKTAAIMFTDIVGYTVQMSEDEDKAFALIKKKRDLLLPLIEKHEGKLIKEIGDGTLTRYFKADDAIECASRFQSKTDDDLKFENILIDKTSADLLKGSEVDYVSELIGEQFKITNPQTVSYTHLTLPTNREV